MSAVDEKTQRPTPLLWPNAAVKACSNVEVLFCAREVDPTEHVSRHRRGSIQAASPTSPNVVLGGADASRSPGAFVKINNHGCNDYKVWYESRADTEPVVSLEVTAASEDKNLTGFAFGLVPLSSLKNPASRGRELRRCQGAVVVTGQGIFVEGKPCPQHAIPESAADGIVALNSAKEGTRLSIRARRCSKRNERVIEIEIDGRAVFSMPNPHKTPLVPCLDMADDRIRGVGGPVAPKAGPSVVVEGTSVFTNPDDKVEDFAREVNMHRAVVYAARSLNLGHRVPDLVGPGLCFVGPNNDPAIITAHLGAPESGAIRWVTSFDIADAIRGKVEHVSIQQQAGVAQGDDYCRNTLCKRKRPNSPVETYLIDFGWAACHKPAFLNKVVLFQLVGFFIEFAHKNYHGAQHQAKDMILRALDIVGSGRRLYRFAQSGKAAGQLVPNWKYFCVWRKAYAKTDDEFFRNRGTNCKPGQKFAAMESIASIKRKLLELADAGYKTRKIAS